jgi:hypothetical protein
MFTPLTANVFLPILIEREQSLSSVKKLHIPQDTKTFPLILLLAGTDSNRPVEEDE